MTRGSRGGRGELGTGLGRRMDIGGSYWTGGARIRYEEKREEKKFRRNPVGGKGIFLGLFGKGEKDGREQKSGKNGGCDNKFQRVHGGV